MLDRQDGSLKTYEGTRYEVITIASNMWGLRTILEGDLLNTNRMVNPVPCESRLFECLENLPGNGKQLGKRTTDVDIVGRIHRKTEDRAMAGLNENAMVNYCSSTRCSRRDGLWRRCCLESGLPGGAGGIRTPDLIIANDALSQLSYSPGVVSFKC